MTTTRLGFIGASATTLAAAAFPADELDAVARALAKPARHRQVFATPRIADGAVCGFMTHSLDAYEIALGEGPGTLHVAAVFYSRGVVLGLNDRMWKTYRLAEAARRRAETLSSTESEANPFARELAALVNRGATLLVCDNALADWSTFLVGSLGIDRAPDDVHADLRANLAPGAHLVPAGVAAVNAAQEARFTYFQAS